MDSSSQQGEGKKNINAVKTFPVPFALEDIKKNININTNPFSKFSKEQLINQAIQLHQKGNIPEATKCYQYFITQGFGDHRVFSNYGAILQDLGKSQDAELLYRKAIEIKPNLAIAHYNLGNTLTDLGNLKEAEISYRKAIELDPTFAIAHYNLGNTLTDLGNLKEAEISYRKVIELDPTFAIAHYNLGNILNDLDNLKEAEISYRKAIELDPTFAMAHSNLGNILQGLGKLQEAEISLRKAIEIKPDYAEAHSNLGNILQGLGKLQEAEISLRKAIEIKPDYAEAHSNLGNILQGLGKLQAAEVSIRKAIELNPDFAMAYSNLGGILIDLGKLREAEVSFRKAIELNPDFAMAHSNLGGILIDLGKLREAEVSIRKAIEIQPNFARAYYSLSLLKIADKNKILQNHLFSKSILHNKLKKDKIDIYFARANILHKEKKYEESSKYLTLANKLKLDIQPSKPEIIFNKSKVLLIESNKKEINQKEQGKSPESIFIVGMFRSGSTLLESILSMNPNVDDLGEIKILEESFFVSRKINQSLTLPEEYLKRIKDLKNQSNITTNKNLFNYQYTGIIAREIPNSKIIHCFRNPLDNILSIFRAHFTHGNEYSSSLVDCAKVYLDQDEIMTEYKNRFRSKIYDLNYDLLVSDPNQEIKSLISWLGWEWDNKYLSPHLNPRSVSTASSVQVRSPINSKSIGGWKNYKDMLKPAMEILTQADKYRDIAS
ncbi:tetratricopeptide repeat-containing sulfotransferase family protein [Prochlorococcus sp. MIT 0916]|uniref:Translation elongation factor P n=1 Tax=Prochlorococcus marinus str. P0903-H212 TaxID=1622208 RepID=A0A0D5A3Q0_PROMR|nr:Translation elongation factor P [Prochlorococcus marinus str. P0903-H212]